MQLSAARAILGSVPLIPTNLVLYLAIYILNPSHGDLPMRKVVFKAHQANSSDDTVCSTEKPNRIVNRVRSKIKCTALCTETPKCAGVNWKEPSTCEMYLSDPRTFETLIGCIYFSPGEPFYFET